MKKIILVILGMFLLGFVLNEISGSKFPIGSTMLHDSTSAIFTINKNVKINGYMQSNGTVIETGETVKTKFVKLPINVIGTGVNTTPHGIANYRNIISVDCVIIEDSLDYFLPLGSFHAAGYSTGFLGRVQGSNCYYYVGSATGYRLLYDTVLFTITYKE